MHTVVRIYSDARAIRDQLASIESDIREVITNAPGFVRYGIVATEDGFFSITTCQDKAGTDESTRRAADYIREHFAGLSGGTPTIVEGERLFSFQA
jgi:hypothetical protein